MIISLVHNVPSARAEESSNVFSFWDKPYADFTDNLTIEYVVSFPFPSALTLEVWSPPSIDWLF